MPGWSFNWGRGPFAAFALRDRLPRRARGACEGQRQALRFEREGEAVEVYDHGVAQLSPYIVLVQHAEQRFDIECTDTPGRWYSWVAVPPVLD